MASSVNNIQIVPVNVAWKMEQTETWDFTGLTKTSLNEKAFQFYSALNAAAHYVWFDGTGSGADPVISGFTAHEVTINATTTAAQIATATAAIVTAITGFDASASGAIVTVKRTDVGETTESFDAAGGDASDIAYALTRRGRDMDLGLLQGDVECSFSPANYMVTAHQTGLTPLAALNQGFESLECTTVMQETQKSNLKDIYTIYGGVASGSTSEVFGVGSASQGKNMMVEAGRLVLKPVNASDDTTNFNFMLAIPVPDSLVFSGENPRTLSITWQGFVDRDFNNKFNAIAIGDVFQDGL